MIVKYRTMQHTMNQNDGLRVSSLYAPVNRGIRMFRKAFLPGVGLVLFFPAAASAASPFGLWARGDGNARVRIAQCGSSLCAINTWIRNPGSEKVGDRLVMRVKKVADRVWKGTAYDPQRKLNMSLQMNIAPRSMTTNGCLLGGLLCRSTRWTRID